MEQTGPPDGSVEGQLLRPRRVHAEVHRPHQGASIPMRRSSRTRSARARCGMLADEVCSTEKMISYCRDHPVAELHHRHRERACCTGCGARFRTRHFIPGPDGPLRVRGLPLHEDEHPGKAARLPAESGAARSSCPSRSAPGPRCRCAGCWSGAGRSRVSLPPMQPRTFPNRFLSTLALLFTAVLCGCEDRSRTARDAAEELSRMLSEHRFAEAYAAASPVFRFTRSANYFEARVRESGPGRCKRCGMG